jgi:hypothetical protein
MLMTLPFGYKDNALISMPSQALGDIFPNPYQRAKKKPELQVQPGAFGVLPGFLLQAGLPTD